MKIFLYIIIISFLSPRVHCQKKKNIYSIIYLDDILSQVEQKIYLSSFCPWISGSEQIIWDSIQTVKGQKHIMLQAYAPIENRLTITFSKDGPQALAIYALPQDTIKLEVTYEDESPMTIYKKAIKGEFHNIIVENKQLEKEYWNNKHKLNEDKKIDSLTLHNQKMIDFYHNNIFNFNYPSLATNSEVMLRLFFNTIISPDSIQSIREYLIRKFPYDPRVALGYAKNTLQTEKGIYSAKRLNEIKRNKESYKKQQQRIQKGDKLKLSLCGFNSEKIALATLNSKYIYVNVWASWCNPCRSQFPYIKKALKKYPNELKIYAISIDRNHLSWKKAIER